MSEFDPSNCGQAGYFIHTNPIVVALSTIGTFWRKKKFSSKHTYINPLNTNQDYITTQHKLTLLLLSYTITPTKATKTRTFSQEKIDHVTHPLSNSHENSVKNNRTGSGDDRWIFESDSALTFGLDQVHSSYFNCVLSVGYVVFERGVRVLRNNINNTQTHRFHSF